MNKSKWSGKRWRIAIGRHIRFQNFFDLRKHLTPVGLGVEEGEKILQRRIKRASRACLFPSRTITHAVEKRPDLVFRAQAADCIESQLRKLSNDTGNLGNDDLLVIQPQLIPPLI